MSDAPVKTKGKRLAFKLSLFILAGTACIFFAAFGYNHYYSRKLVLKGVEENARNLTMATINKIETILVGVEKVPLYLATSLGNRTYDRKEIIQSLEDILNTNPDIFGTTAAFEPFSHNPSSRYFAPYYYRDKNGLRLVYLGGESYQYFFLEWYRIPKEMGKSVWSEPYFDEGGGQVTMSTYSVPFYRSVGGKRIFTGIVTADVSLEWLKNIVSQVSIYQTGYAFLVSQNGVIVTHPKEDWIMRKTIFSIAEAAGDLGLRQIGRDMTGGKEGFVPMQSHFAGKKSWIYYAPLPSIGWSIGIVFPEDELFADMKTLNREVLIIGSVGFVFLFLVIIWISTRITKPISALSLKTAEIARGNLDIELPKATSNDEVGELTSSFENMRVALKEYISTLKETTAAKERLESELKIARTIQMSFLPKIFPPFPERDEFEIYATIEPAREVGGDLYDFFLVDGDYLFFSVGDVSGKGVPAALFMAVTKTLMKGIAGQGLEPGKVLERVNIELCRENEAMMFCTVFCGLLNVKTGECVYSNAGHNPPLLVRSGRRPEWLDLPEGFLMGINEDSAYRTEKIALAPGDTLILYTDGVTEAMDCNKVLYAEDRLMDAVERNKSHPVHLLVPEIMKSVKNFTGGEPQSDDITILTVRFRGKN